MSTDDEPEIIDVEVVEIIEADNLPAVVEVQDRTYRSEPPIQEVRDWPQGPSPERRCVAHRKNGDRCKNAAIKGASVCRYHGGAADHVKRAARARLENAADLMAKQLLGIALTADNENVKLSAIKDALDRAGLKAPAEIVVSHGEPKAYETVFDAIGGNLGESIDASIDYGQQAPPAPAYDQHDAAAEAEAGEQTSQSSDPEPPPSPRPRDNARDRPPRPPERHITGEAAIWLANQANRQIGALPPLPALESPHRRYRRP
jgi:hypothetical protein